MDKVKVHQVKVTINIQPGPATNDQREAWSKFWQLLILTAREKSEAAK